jgi:K+-transporting ATPase A subunit
MNRTIILALSLAVVLMAATASTASTAPNPPAPPLTLSVQKGAHVSGKTLRFGVRVSNDSTVVATGSKIEKTKKRVAAALEQCPEGTDDSPPRGARRVLH